MTQYTFDFDGFSDLYKDVNGIRPRNHQFYWDSTTDDDRQEMWDFYCRELDAVIEERKRDDERAVELFEKEIETLIGMGAKGRDGAIRWIIDSIDHYDGDWDYVSYQLDLPYDCDQTMEIKTIMQG